MHRLTLVWCIAIALASEKMPTPAVSRLYAGLGSIYFPFIPSVVYPPRIHMRRGIALQPHQMREEDRAMSLNLVAGIAIPSQLPTATTPYFPLGLSSTGRLGHWGDDRPAAEALFYPTSCHPICAQGEPRRQFQHCSLPRRT